MLFLGRRGRQVDSHPHCARCGYDLFGQPEDSRICPECGAELDSGKSIRIGTRERRIGLMLGGLAMTLGGAVPLGIMSSDAARTINLMHLKPTSWLLMDAVAETYQHQPNRDEIERRLENHAMSSSDQKRVANFVLSRQADRSTTWDTYWGDMFVLLRASGTLSDGDWQKYLSQGEYATLRVRPNIARGDPIPFEIRNDLRGATAFFDSGSSLTLLQFSATVAGTTGKIEITHWWDGLPVEVWGHAILPENAWNDLRPGKQSMTVDASGYGGDIPLTPRTLDGSICVFAPVSLQGSWTLLPKGIPSVTMFHDEQLAAQVRKTFRYLILADRDLGDPKNASITVIIHDDYCPVRLAYDVIVKSGVQEWNLGMLLISNRQWDPNGHYFRISQAHDLIGQRGEIILRPSLAAAACTVDIVNLLDHEFVFKNVLFDTPPLNSPDPLPPE